MEDFLIILFLTIFSWGCDALYQKIKKRREAAQTSDSQEPAATDSPAAAAVRPSARRIGYTPLPAEDERVTDATPEATEPMAAVDPAVAAARAAHYARWRQAVVDAQVLQRKF